ncbi:MAG: hypothetical protein DMG73_19515, partial [Acidobacteria bacterium]
PGQQQLEYDFQVAPGADAGQIRLSVSGSVGLALDNQGNLVVHTAAGDLIQHAPVLSQQVDGNARPISGQFVLHGENQVGFRVGAYDPSKPLLIDPSYVYSTAVLP